MDAREGTHEVDPETTPPAPSGRGRTGPGGTLDRAAVAWGAAIGLVLVIAVATARAVLDEEIDDFDETGWVLPLFVLLLVAYLVAGWVAQRRAGADGHGDTPLTHGALAGLGAFVLWIPIRIGIWLVRDEGRGLVSGSDGALRPSQVFGGIVIAAGIGMLGGYLASRRARPSTPSPSER